MCNRYVMANRTRNQCLVFVLFVLFLMRTHMLETVHSKFMIYL
jgi:hypothetical protein